jgi:hypothetical protein
VLNLLFDKAFDLCAESVAQIKRSKITKEDRINGKIDAKGGITWKTFGDKIEFNLNKINEAHTEVELSSRPVLRTTLVDYGKNLQNVQIIEEFLKEYREV